MTPRLGALLLILWTCSLLYTYQLAADNARNEYRAAKVPVLEAAIQKHNVQANAGHMVEKKAVVRAARTAANFERLDNEVLNYAQTHPLAGDCSIDADGLRTWRAANSNAEAAAAGRPDAGLRRIAPAGEREGAGPAGRPRQSDQDVSPMQGATALPGGMDGDNQ